jgi:hypothetical protein
VNREKKKTEKKRMNPIDLVGVEPLPQQDWIQDAPFVFPRPTRYYPGVYRRTQRTPDEWIVEILDEENDKTREKHFAFKGKRSLKYLFNKLGAETLLRYDPRSFVEWLNYPDLLLTACRAQGRPGYELYRRIRNLAWGQDSETGGLRPAPGAPGDQGPEAPRAPEEPEEEEEEEKSPSGFIQLPQEILDWIEPRSRRGEAFNQPSAFPIRPSAPAPPLRRSPSSPPVPQGSPILNRQGSMSFQEEAI